MPLENIHFQCPQNTESFSAASQQNQKGKGKENEDRGILVNDTLIENPPEFFGQLFSEMQVNAKERFDLEKAKEINQNDDIISGFRKFYDFILQIDRKANGTKIADLEQRLGMVNWNPSVNEIDQEQIIKFLNGFAIGFPFFGKILQEGGNILNLDSFKKIIKAIDSKPYSQPGSTASAYIFNPETLEITTANLGDSRVYLVIKHNEPESENATKNEYRTILLTQDHSLDLKRVQDCVGEKNIDKAGRFCGLNLGGGIGDFDKEIEGKTIIRTPDIATFNAKALAQECLGEECKVENCEFYLINASDGLEMGTRNNYDFYVDFPVDRNNPVVARVETGKKPLSKFVQDYEREGHNNSLSDYLAKESKSSDDVTVITFKFTPQTANKESVCVFGAIFDGHGIANGKEISTMCLEKSKELLQMVRQKNNDRSKTPDSEFRHSVATKAEGANLSGSVELV